MNPIGFSVIYSKKHDSQFYARLFSDMLAVGCRAIELHVPQYDKIDDPELLELIRSFEYRAIHTSDLHSSTRDKDILHYYQELVHSIDAAAVTVHPHTMESWGWVAGYFGDLVSFENMDRFKPFGRSPEDMRQILDEHPTARWTFDLNHVYTNDPDLLRVSDFYEQLGDPGHYHISGFKDKLLPHTTLYTTRQDSIIASVATRKPVIIESLGSDDIHLFREEYNYVAMRLR